MPDQEKTFFLGIIGDSLLGWPPRRVVKGSLSKHRNGDGENAVHDASESSSMAALCANIPGTFRPLKLV